MINYEVRNSTTMIGRDQNLELRVHDPRISRNQCELIVIEADGMIKVLYL